MFALIDCNSFFCSVERAFHAGLARRPVCVLSSNDGCIVALTPEAKALGLRRGDPLFRVRDTVRRGGVSVFSSNIALYAAMSRRITSIVRRSVPRVEVYSIDESFCDLSPLPSHTDLTALMRGVAERVLLWTGVPVSVGIAPTKTLAKMCSKFAKQYPGYRSVCLIDSEERRRRALALFPLSDVWGIGRGTLTTLRCHGIETPLAFAEKSEAWVRARLPLPARRTWEELNGRPCIDTAEARRHKSVCRSRSFGEMITTPEALSEAVAHFAASCGIKLRGEGSAARELLVFAASNPFRGDLPQYHGSLTHTFPIATSDTVELTKAARALAMRLFRPGIHFKRAGVVLSDIVPATPMQLSLFDDTEARLRRLRLMKAIDSVNQRYGARSLRLAAEGDTDAAWLPKSVSRSPDFLTSIDGLLTVRL